MQTTFSILFYPRGNDIDKNGYAPVYARITVNGKRSEFSIRRKVQLTRWNSDAGKIRGTTPDVRELNKYLLSIELKINKIQEQLSENNILITAEKIKNIYLGKNSNQKMLLAIFQEHNDQVNELIGKDFSAGTAERYKTAMKHVTDYILKEYQVKDIPVREVDLKFITGFEYYLKTTRNCAHNSAIKYVTNFKKIIRIAYANDWISKDPFIHWKAKLKIVDREFLTSDEIQRIVEKDFSTDRLNQVKDIFIFSCFTGLAYADVKKLTKNDIVIGIDGQNWIKTKRTKTDTRSNIPILSIPESIIDKYEVLQESLDTELLLPVLSNQKMNAYLKEIADLCKINKNLTFHLARHTFATTVTLTNGVSIESVSKMLGHKSLRTTQHYAKILDKKVSDDMKALKNKFADLNNTKESPNQKSI
ncbi:site-specific integrase [Tamlana sp. 2_MG-2023]|uniref:site-specific integrase n=1 Tax=unclassified Tamlana TaxID=2614803 RepID=UPI0026E32377|nr:MULTISPECIES: site-specific integrase [unclassified Tamlana]MDO6759162.1 site-specific integrase [Tamlana sp. 2_MG-2023]MDO6790699.1 site-specific integrase [Tamlana sp. 1_MG-2023]